LKLSSEDVVTRGDPYGFRPWPVSDGGGRGRRVGRIGSTPVKAAQTEIKLHSLATQYPKPSFAATPIERMPGVRLSDDRRAIAGDCQRWLSNRAIFCRLASENPSQPPPAIDIEHG
jgi:hypothetical protein